MVSRPLAAITGSRNIASRVSAWRCDRVPPAQSWQTHLATPHHCRPKNEENDIISLPSRTSIPRERPELEAGAGELLVDQRDQIGRAGRGAHDIGEGPGYGHYRERQHLIRRDQTLQYGRHGAPGLHDRRMLGSGEVPVPVRHDDRPPCFLLPGRVYATRGVQSAAMMASRLLRSVISIVSPWMPDPAFAAPGRLIVR